MIEPILISGPDVWMESEATRQLAAVAQLEGCVHAAGMPDLHPGRGFPIGAVVACRDVVHPHLVGGDAGCGARVVVTSVERTSPDRLERRLRAAFEAPVLEDVDPDALFDAVWHAGVRAFTELDGVPEDLRWLAARDLAAEAARATATGCTPDDALGPSGDAAPYRAGFARALGTIGGGNHFAELARVGPVLDREAGASIGLARDAVVVVAHSGSRGLGAALAETWGIGVLRGADRDRYLGELAGACRFARANRLVLTYRLLSALGALRDHTLRGGFDVTHNDVRREAVAGADAWVHRKGAAPAPAGPLAIVLASRGAPSWIMKGTGAAPGLGSVAHGAGRRMTRSEAVDKLKQRYRRSEVTRSATGGRVICDDKILLFEEHPDAYKAIEPVIAALETHGQATRVAALTPIATVKL